MSTNTETNAQAEAQAGVGTDDLVQLTVNIGFYSRPLFIDPDDSADEPTVKEGPPFIRFPVQLGTKDARVIQQLLAGRIAFIAFEVQERDGNAGYYRTITTRD